MGLLNRLLDRFWPMDDVPMSCHCWQTREVWIDGKPHGQIVMPEKHADWCPAGMTHAEFLASHAGRGDGE